MGERKDVDVYDNDYDEGYKFGHKNSPNVLDEVDCDVEFTSCSVSCGGGVKSISYIITQKRGGGRSCPKKEQTCNEGPC